MAASVTIRVYTGASAATQSDAVTGIDLISADNAINSAANRISFPISACSRSYEKYLKAVVDVAPDNKVENFQVWGDGSIQSNTALYYGFSVTGSAPVNTDSSLATTDFTTATSAAKATWQSASMKAAGSATQFLVFQLDVLTAATAGNMGQEVVSWSFDEA